MNCLRCGRFMKKIGRLGTPTRNEYKRIWQCPRDGEIGLSDIPSNNGQEEPI